MELVSKLSVAHQLPFEWGSAPAVIAETFGLILIAEWDDGLRPVVDHRLQIATIALAAANPPAGVFLGAVLGHTICAAIAVSCGRYVCGRLSERTLTAAGGGLFLLFAVMALLPSF